jgi:hypothetical protein
MSQTAKKKSLHEVLGVDLQADVATIERQYHARLAALEGVPHTPESENQRKFLLHAYETLSNPLQRQMYEQRLLNAAAPAAAPTNFDDEQPSRRVPWLAATGVASLLLLAWAGYRLTHNHAPATSGTPQARLPAGVQMSPMARPTARGTAQLSPSEVFRKVSDSIVVVLGEVPAGNGHPGGISQGSGVVIANGQIVTNCHVTSETHQLKISYHDQLYDATPRYIDRGHDLCQLEANALSAPPIEIGSVEDVTVGDPVLALGTPKGLELTLSEGIVSSLREESDSKLIQTSAPISPGSSGGGLFDRRGRLVGITTFQMREGQNLNFAVPADWIAQLRSRDGNQDRLLDSGHESGSAAPPDPRNQTLIKQLNRHWSCEVTRGHAGSVILDIGAEGSFSFAFNPTDGKPVSMTGSYQQVSANTLSLQLFRVGSGTARLMEYDDRNALIDLDLPGEHLVVRCAYRQPGQ